MLPFTKMEGLGNDYVYVDGFAHAVADPPALARAIADRHFGVGGDGLILLLPPDGAGAHLRMRMFNADGSESEMCGNGIRCVCKLAYDRGLCRADPMRVQTGAGVLELRYRLGAGGRVDRVTVDMGRPRLEAAEIPVSLPGVSGRIVDLPAAGRLRGLESGAAWLETAGVDGRITAVSMGNPHLVVFCKDVRAVPLEAIGPRLETDPAFPRRVNVHFVEVHGPGEVTMVTWERGSGRTLACGTGASAVCVAGALTGRTRREILAHLPGGDLELVWDEDTDHVMKTGPAREVFTGVWEG